MTHGAGRLAFAENAELTRAAYVAIADRRPAARAFVGERVDAGAIARQKARRAAGGADAGAIAYRAAAARGAALAGGVAAAESAAEASIDLGIDTGAITLDETLLTRELAESSAIADGAIAAGLTALTVGVDAAEAAIGEAIDALIRAKELPLRTRRHALAQLTDKATVADRPRVGTLAVVRRAAEGRMELWIDASIAALDEAYLAREPARAGPVAYQPSGACGAGGWPLAVSRRAAEGGVHVWIDTYAVAIDEPIGARGRAGAIAIAAHPVGARSAARPAVLTIARDIDAEPIAEPAARRAGLDASADGDIADLLIRAVAGGLACVAGEEVGAARQEREQRDESDPSE